MRDNFLSCSKKCCFTLSFSKREDIFLVVEGYIHVIHQHIVDYYMSTSL